MVIFFQIIKSLKRILLLGYEDQFVLLSLYHYRLDPHEYQLICSTYAYNFGSLLAHAVVCCETPQVISHHLLAKVPPPKVAHLLEGGTSSDEIGLPDRRRRFVCFLLFLRRSRAAFDNRNTRDSVHRPMLAFYHLVIV